MKENLFRAIVCVTIFCGGFAGVVILTIEGERALVDESNRKFGPLVAKILSVPPKQQSAPRLDMSTAYYLRWKAKAKASEARLESLASLRDQELRFAEEERDALLKRNGVLERQVIQNKIDAAQRKQPVENKEVARRNSPTEELSEALIELAKANAMKQEYETQLKKLEEQHRVKLKKLEDELAEKRDLINKLRDPHASQMGVQ